MCAGAPYVFTPAAERHLAPPALDAARQSRPSAWSARQRQRRRCSSGHQLPHPVQPLARRRARPGRRGRSRPCRAKFDASADVVEQHEATSTDGTKIPYFVVHRRDMKFDGTNPTLLYAYGGFESARRRATAPRIGKLWLERGGVYVLANIRGGGEFGPKWHEAGLRTKRQSHLRRLRRGRPQDLIAPQDHHARAGSASRAAQRRPADGRRVHPASRALERGRDRRAAARHDPHLEDRRRRVAGRANTARRAIRRSAPSGEDLALPEPASRARNIPSRSSSRPPRTTGSARSTPASSPRGWRRCTCPSCSTRTPKAATAPAPTSSRRAHTQALEMIYLTRMLMDDTPGTPGTH